MMVCDIPMGAVVIDMGGKNVGKFKCHISHHVTGPFRFNGHELTLLMVHEPTNFQVWQGNVDERDLAACSKWFSRNAYSAHVAVIADG